MRGGFRGAARLDQAARHAQRQARPDRARPPCGRRREARRLKIKLPRGAAGATAAWRKGMQRQAARELGRAHWKLTRRGITVTKLPASGVASVRLVLRRAARFEPARRFAAGESARS